ncbi:hypothetical protein [Flavobacterium sp. MK4S-17]|jgi:hypothetical protein|uniref:hypothetical protein n=1 Tax=Flavobacterium sp. MK4S-17 TaxID=2543737 RepID=UPI0013587720|nr:hypothetical protein [Flavobacterium sp. MK4S-17]
MHKLFILLFFSGMVCAGAQTKNGWEEWQKTSCYSKISFRLKEEKKRGNQYRWKIQFRNDYNEVISFNYHVTDKLQQYNITTHRKTLNPLQLSDEIEVFTREEDIYILVDKVSLSPFPENFLDCDH